MSEPKSIESFLGNPIEETLVDAEELEEQIVKTKAKSKQRGHAVKYEFYKQFDNITEIQKEISNGVFHNGHFIFKFQDECKFRYYCTHQKNGCRAALYLELID
ncbi:unnamed protein product [Brachionus calyciflorus]|uniref:Uncharacterized protein n=1 Tax=Brachionus calyciflorus TaxID=104777 RepID=A0A814FP29_9BILA|nr:unnamed protein product [Brachionus calyciflorus]